MRPSIVTAALKEPVPGWVDNLNGPTGITCSSFAYQAAVNRRIAISGSISAVGKGFLRVMKVDKDLVSDIIPVDYPINLMIAVAWYTAVHRLNK